METRTSYQIVNAEYDCDHPETDIRRRMASNGVQHWVRQCVRCGHNAGGVKREDVPGLRRINPVEFDESLLAAWSQKRSERHQGLQQEWWQKYNAYLESPEWKARRKAVLERDEFLCQGCRKQRATQVHHLTYDRKGNEMLFDLVAVCDECHAAIHPAEPSDAP